MRYNINRDSAWTIFGGGGSVSGDPGWVTKALIARAFGEEQA